MATDADTCLQALDALYNHPDNKVKKEADQYLTGMFWYATRVRGRVYIDCAHTTETWT